MNRQFTPNLEILLKNHCDKSSSIQSTNYRSFGDCYITYVGNFLVIEKVINPTENTVEHRFTPLNLDDIQTFRYTHELKTYTEK